jgi:hypothetical protein
MLGVDVGYHYFNKNSMQANNEHEVFVVKCPFIMD